MSGTAAGPSETAERVSRNTVYADLPEWMSAREAAAYLGITPWSVYQHCHQGNIPYRRLGPKLIQIPKSWFHPSRAQQQVTT